MNVSLGDTARIEVAAFPNRSFGGIVTEIANDPGRHHRNLS